MPNAVMKTLTIFIILFCISTLRGQGDTTRGHLPLLPDEYIVLNTEFGSNGTLEIGVSRQHNDWFLKGLSYGAACEITQDGLHYTPKLFGQVWFVGIVPGHKSRFIVPAPLGLKCSLLGYNIQTDIDLRLRTQIGMNLFGMITVYYGRDIKLNDKEFNVVKPSGWYFGLALPLWDVKGKHWGF